MGDVAVNATGLTGYLIGPRHIGTFLRAVRMSPQRGGNYTENYSLATFALGDSNHATRNDGAGEGSSKEIDILRADEYVFGVHYRK